MNCSWLSPACATLVALSVPVLTSCGSSDGTGGNSSSPAPVMITDDALDVNFSTDGTPTAVEGALGPNGCPAPTDDKSCRGQVFAGETLPIDIYVMFDQSGSMLNVEENGTTRIDAVREAVREFVRDEHSAGIGIGLGYFGYQPIGETTCDAADYARADVPVGLLPQNASDITASLDTVEPLGETPTGAAIGGACSYAEMLQESNGIRDVVILLVTDGEPKAPVTSSNGGCTPTLEDAVNEARECLDGKGHIRSYVLGVGPFLDNLGEIAEAGGTREAYLVEGGDVAAKVLDALNRIRADAIPCDLELPPAPNGETLDLTTVNLSFSDAECLQTDFYYVETPEACDTEGGGWYYDDPNQPETIRLCKSSCDTVGLPGGQLYMTLGCETRVQIR